MMLRMILGAPLRFPDGATSFFDHGSVHEFLGLGIAGDGVCPMRPVIGMQGDV